MKAILGGTERGSFVSTGAVSSPEWNRANQGFLFERFAERKVVLHLASHSRLIHIDQFSEGLMSQLTAD